ncbi:hypothetical protein [Streptomyces sp. C36]|uniref:hypothetical protein n=1 Tax=Streptomyces sp. C36 TaxID=3237122 RepID=UPI0034C67B92
MPLLLGLLDIPGLCTSLVLAALLTGGSATRRWLRSRGTQPSTAEPPRTLRRYTLLRTSGLHGTADQYETTRPPGTVITHRIGDRPQRFELTDVPLGDGTYAAEPLD